MSSARRTGWRWPTDWFANCSVTFERIDCLLYPVLSSEPLSYFERPERKYWVAPDVPLTLKSVSYDACALPKTCV